LTSSLLKGDEVKELQKHPKVAMNQIDAANFVRLVMNASNFIIYVLWAYLPPKQIDYIR